MQKCQENHAETISNQDLANQDDNREHCQVEQLAESWLGWRGPLVRVLTLGIVNPHRMVDAEVQKSLAEYQSTINAALWWVTVQTGLRLAFGLTLWTVWAIQVTG